jgi:hypothetical protein
MKLLIANHHLEDLAGSELHMADLCRGFRRAGHEVLAFTMKPGPVADVLKEEGFTVFSLRDLHLLSEESFDLIYLHHSTCEALLGLLFAGQVPIVRGYLGIVPPLEKPISGDFLAGKTYGSELVQRTHAAWHPGIPSLIARNVYDDQQVQLEPVHRAPQPTQPNFAVVTNHLDPDLARLLEEAEVDSLCRFTHFGLPHNSVPVTADLLMSFDAVITIGRTVVLAAALGKPVYVCDVHGADGWLTRENFAAAQTNTFSGRTLAIKNWNCVREQLLDTKRWPTFDDLAWLRERVERDHALSHRIEQLQVFFTDIIEMAPPPAPAPGGYLGVLQFIEEKENLAQARQQQVEELSRKVEELSRGLAEEHRNAQRLSESNQHLTLRAQGLQQQIQEIQNSRTWRLFGPYRRLRARGLKR